MDLSFFFFRFSDFKFSTQFVSTLIVAGIILFQVSWPRYRWIPLQWCRDSIFNINRCERPTTAVQFGKKKWVKKILTPLLVCLCLDCSCIFYSFWPAQETLPFIVWYLSRSKELWEFVEYCIRYVFCGAKIFLCLAVSVSVHSPLT